MTTPRPQDTDPLRAKGTDRQEDDMSEPQAYQDGPNTHKYRTADHITNWTVIPLYDPVFAVKHYYHVPTVLVEEIERRRPYAGWSSPPGPLSRLVAWVRKWRRG